MSKSSEYNNIVCSRKIFTLPNVLSMMRIVLIPVMVVLFIFGYYITTSVLLILSAITDLVDGYIARKFNCVSEIGKALDPVADKLTQCAVLVCLSFYFEQIWIPVGVLVLKEFFTGITQLIIMRKCKLVVGADWYGKITTAFLYVMMFMHIIWSIWGGIPQMLSWILIGISIFMMVSSLILYAVRNIKIIKSCK